MTEEILHVNKLANNRIYIPKEIRELLKIKNGNKILFIQNKAINENEIILRRSKPTEIDTSDVTTY